MKSMSAAEVLEYRSKMSENVVKEFGPEHPSMYFMNIYSGDVSKTQGKLQEAQALYTKALMIAEQCFGEGSLGVAVFYGLLAEIAKAEGKAADATDFVEVSIQMLENCGEKPAEVLQYADQLATIYYSEGGIQG